MRFFILITLIFFTTNLFAYEEKCLVGDVDTFYKFSQQQPPDVPYVTGSFDSTQSACAAMLQKMQQSSFWGSGYIKSINEHTGSYTCNVFIKERESPFTEHDVTGSIEQSLTPKDCSCPYGESRNFYGNCVSTCPSGSSWNGQRCVLEYCPQGQQLSQTGDSCVAIPEEPTQCPDGYYSDGNSCKKFVECEPGFVADPDGVCWPEEEEEEEEEEQEDLNPCDPESKWYFLCQWFSDWKDFSNNIKDQFNSLFQTTNEIKQQNQQFYNEVRDFLDNYNPNTSSNPTTIYPQLPAFCDWSTNMCQWYTDWKLWRSEYQQNEQKQTEDNEKILEKQQQQLDQDKSFQDDARDYFDFMKEQKEEEIPSEGEQPTQPEEPTAPEPDNQQRVNWNASCPITNQNQTITLEGQTTTLQGFDMTEACSMAAKMRPLILLAGALISLLIIARGHS